MIQDLAQLKSGVLRETSCDIIQSEDFDRFYYIMKEIYSIFH